MNARTRTFLAVGAAALAAAAVVVGVTAVTSDAPAPSATEAGPQARAGTPPLSLDLGVRTDGEAVDLRKAVALYDVGKLADAERIFARHDSLEARIGQAFGSWPDGTLARLTQLSGLHPRSAAVQLNLGIARYWAGEAGEKEAWRQAATLQPDTAYAVTANNLLHPEYARNLPVFVPEETVPVAITRLSAPQQLAVLARRARAGAAVDHLFYGVALQRLGRQISAEREYALAARAAPRDPEARVAAAVALFDKSRPVRAFSTLGPLTRTFPRAGTVRFHLGLLLLWSGQVQEARRQLRKVAQVDPGSPLVGVARQYLDELRKAGV